MRRTTPLTVASLLGLALLAPTTSASAAGETCRGEAATIVGTSPNLTGTEGRDVIVTGRATDVKALGGDDLICVVPLKTNINIVSVDAGTGNDTVDTTGAPSGYYVDTDLGPGEDTLEGGVAGDTVTTGDAVGVTTEVDVVRPGDGNDTVKTSGGSDVVDLGAGDDRLELQGSGTARGVAIAGGDGFDTWKMTVSSTYEDNFDMTAGTYRSSDAAADFSSFEGLDLTTSGATIGYLGTEGRDYLNVETTGGTATITASMLGGDDDLTLDGALISLGTRIDVGSGADRLVAARERGSLALDLERGELVAAGDTHPVLGVEEAFLMARRVSLVGDAQANTLIANACTGTITGGRGDDELIHDHDYFFEEYSYRCEPAMVMRGGPGNDSFYGSRGDDRLFGFGGADTIRGEGGDDRIRGGAGADRIYASRGDDDVRGGGGADELDGEEGRDVLIGGGGRDKAKGGPGSDRCVAERERQCER